MSKRRKKKNLSSKNDLLAKLHSVNRKRTEMFLQSVGDVKSDDDKRKKFDETVELIGDVLNNTNPINALAVMSFANSFNTSSSNIPGEISSHLRLPQSFIELLQAITLTQPMNELRRPFLGQHLAVVSQALVRLNALAIIFRARKIKNLKNRNYVLESLRLQTQLVRNWAFPHQIERITREIFSTLDEQFYKIHGFALTELNDLFFKLVSIVEARTTVHHEKGLEQIRPIMNAENVESAISEFSVIFKIDKDALKERYGSQTPTLFDIQSMAFSIVNDKLPWIFQFDLEKIKSLFPREISTDTLSSMMNSLAFGFGDLNKKDVGYFVLDNPIALKPFIKLKEDEYYCPVPGILITSIFNILEKLVESTDETMKQSYHTARARFLEKSPKV